MISMFDRAGGRVVVGAWQEPDPEEDPLWLHLKVLES